VVACIFVDRDGTLIEDRGYAHRVEDYARLPGAVEGLRLLRAAGYRLAIVTNQSGIGRGYFDEAAFERFQAHLLDDFRAAGVEFDAVYHCPHRPDAGCDCRKPEPGLLRRAERELGVELARSWVIGDQLKDLELAARAACRGCVHVCSDGSVRTPDGVASAVDLEAAARVVLAASAQEPQ
jgi:D-glycero-D-manno-heptose 1,7-bisphosphate phosphatase